jgi:hypothetical protein
MRIELFPELQSLRRYNRRGQIIRRYQRGAGAGERMEDDLAVPEHLIVTLHPACR